MTQSSQSFGEMQIWREKKYTHYANVFKPLPLHNLLRSPGSPQNQGGRCGATERRMLGKAGRLVSVKKTMEPFPRRKVWKSQAGFWGREGQGWKELPQRLRHLQREKHLKRLVILRWVAGQISHFVTSSGEFRKHVLFKTLGIAIYVSFDETDFRGNKWPRIILDAFPILGRSVQHYENLNCNNI